MRPTAVEHLSDSQYGLLFFLDLVRIVPNFRSQIDRDFRFLLLMLLGRLVFVIGISIRKFSFRCLVATIVVANEKLGFDLGFRFGLIKLRILLGWLSIVNLSSFGSRRHQTDKVAHRFLAQIG